MFRHTQILTVPEQIAQSIQQSIEEGRITVGERIPTELELADEFNVSRPTVREALRILTQKNLLSVQKGRNGGYFVEEVSAVQAFRDVPDMIELSLRLQTLTKAELFEVRKIIEVPSAGLAAKRRTDEELNELENMLPPSDLAKIDAHSLIEADLRFHSKLAECTHNPILASFIYAINVVFHKLSMDFDETKKGYVTLFVPEILDSLRAKDSQGASELMDKHLNNFLTYFNI